VVADERFAGSIAYLWGHVVADERIPGSIAYLWGHVVADVLALTQSIQTPAGGIADSISRVRDDVSFLITPGAAGA
jgi:hypothetical protein